MKHAFGRLCVILVLGLSGCMSSPPTGHSEGAVKSTTTVASASQSSSTRRGGGYYKDDGPADEIPAGLELIPDAVPRLEPLHRFANRPYSVFGKTYSPHTTVKPFTQEGVASWYGKKFHGQKTSIGEVYDMFAMTAAHPTLALPSYARVTNLENGKSVVVRVIDRGPFHASRVIDMSYAAAHRLDYIPRGSARVRVEAIIPGQSLPDTEVASSPLPSHTATDTDEIGALAEQWARIKRGDDLKVHGGVYLQLGAFSSYENADSFRSHLLRELTWLSGSVEIQLREDKMFRVHLGPYPEREAAEKVAQKVKANLGYTPTIITR